MSTQNTVRRESVRTATARCSTLRPGKFKDHEAVVRGDEWFCYIQPTDEGWCLRYFQVYLYSNSRTRTGEEYTLFERHRCFYSLALQGYTGFYDWGNFRQTGEMRFLRGLGAVDGKL